jgi:hypothetical protein
MINAAAASGTAARNGKVIRIKLHPLRDGAAILTPETKKEKGKASGVAGHKGPLYVCGPGV